MFMALFTRRYALVLALFSSDGSFRSDVIDEMQYWVSFLRSSVERRYRQDPNHVKPARLHLVLTHLDCCGESHGIDAAVSYVAEKAQSELGLGEGEVPVYSNEPPPSEPHYLEDDPRKLFEAKERLLEVIRQQVIAT